MYERILVPTDGSEGTAETLAHALAIAADQEATLHGLYVVNKQLYLASDAGEKDEVIAELEADGEAALADVEAEASEAGVSVVTELRRGVPHRDILAYAEEADVDLIVMGTHGRTGREKIVSLGSVTERVVKDSPVPVLTVRMGDAAE